MAATRLIPLHVNKGKTDSQNLKDRLDYAENPKKTEGGRLVDSYECDPRLAWQEFTLCRNEYLASRRSARDSDVIAYQIRQAFKPGEVTPEEANKIGYELAMRFTKGKKQGLNAIEQALSEYDNQLKDATIKQGKLETEQI